MGGSRMGGSRMGGSRMGGSRMGGSRMGGSRMGGAPMAGSRMGGSRMAGMGGSRMGGSRMGDLGGSRMGGSRMGGTMMPNQGSMMMATQGQAASPQPTIPGNPTKTILNEDEMVIEGTRFIEKKTLRNDGNLSYITHSRTIGDAVYEVVATVQNGTFIQFDVHTNLENEEEIYTMEQMWISVWPVEDPGMIGGSMMALPADGMGGSRMGGTMMAGSRMGGSRMGGSRMGGSRMGGSRMGGSRMGGSRMGGSRMGGSRMEGAGGSKMAG